MKTTRNLRLRLRLIEGALLLLLGAFTAGAVATHQLLLDAANRPTSNVSLSDSHWIGTLDPARLPATVPLITGGTDLAIPGAMTAEYFNGGGGNIHDLDAGNIDAGRLDPNRLLNDYGELDLGGDLSVGNMTVEGEFYLDDYQLVDAWGNLFAPGNLTFYGNLLSNGSLLADSGGNFYANGQLIADTNANLYANNLYAGGNLLADSSGNLYVNSYLLADPEGEIYAGGNLAGDADGYLHTGGQTYQAGAVTPTGFLTFKDAAGTIYRVPAAHAP